MPTKSKTPTNLRSGRRRDLSKRPCLRPPRRAPRARPARRVAPAHRPTPATVWRRRGRTRGFFFFLASLIFVEFRNAAGLCAVHYPGWAGGQPHGLPENQQSRTKVWLPPLSTREAALRPYDDYPCVCEVLIVRPRPGDNARFVSLPHPSRVIGVLRHVGGSNAPADGVGGIHSRQPLEIFIF